MDSEKARLLRSYHHEGPVLVLPNAWDVASAVVIAKAGARVVASTSAGVAWALGHPDGQRIARAEMIDMVRRIAAAVDVPVTADVEGGYGDVPATVAEVVAAGAVGVNLEDGIARGEPLRDVEEQAELLRAARATSSEVVINARTDVFLFQQGGVTDVVKRGAAYAEAGADCLFVPGLVDVAVIREIVDAVPLPVSAMAVPGGPGVAELAEAGVRRISVGPALSAGAYEFAHAAAARLLADGVLPDMGKQIGFPQLNSWLAG